MHTLKLAIEKLSCIQPAVLNEFIAKWKYTATTKDTILLRENAIADTIFFIKKGVVRIFYKKNGKEITEWIAIENSFFLSIASFFERTPSHLIIHTIEDCEIFSIDYNDFMQMANTHHNIETLLRKMVTLALILAQKRMQSIAFETAAQRYANLLQQNATIIKRVPLSYIASFLGITLETLSRIRAAK